VRELRGLLHVDRQRPLDTRANILAMVAATNAINMVPSEHRGKLKWFVNFLHPEGQRPVKNKGAYSTGGKKSATAGGTAKKGKGGGKKGKGGGSV
jgi:hypothetical protein